MDGSLQTRKVTIVNSTATYDIVDDFESYEDFSLSCSPWIMNDVDQSTTYGIEDIDFTNSGSPMSFIVFNRNQTNPATLNEAWNAHSGEKYLACFAATTPPNNDWLISPRVLISDMTKFDFWAKSITDQYGLERFKVAVSTTGTDFTVISEGDYVEAPIEWTYYNYDLSQYSGQEVYIAINCVSHDAFAFMVDDIEIDLPTRVENVEQLPSEYVLEQNHPNPFNPVTKIGFVLPQKSKVTIELHNIVGEKVAEIVSSKIYNIGNWEVELNTGSLASGVYFYTIKAGAFTKSMKLILLK